MFIFRLFLSSYLFKKLGMFSVCSFTLLLRSAGGLIMLFGLGCIPWGACPFGGIAPTPVGVCGLGLTGALGTLFGLTEKLLLIRPLLLIGEFGADSTIPVAITVTVQESAISSLYIAPKMTLISSPASSCT